MKRAFLSSGSSGRGLGEVVDIGLVELERQQVRIGEVAVVVRLFLRAHGAGLALAGIEQAGLLVDRAAVLEDARSGGAPRTRWPGR